jgi:hypothetical protein
VDVSIVMIRLHPSDKRGRSVEDNAVVYGITFVAILWLVKTKRRPVFSLKTLLSMNGRELREGGLRSQDRLGKEWKSSTRRARNGFPLPLMMQRSSSGL